MKVKKKYIILLSIVGVLIVARLLLPYFVTRYVNKVLADIPGYWGKIDDVDIHLYRGAYQVQGMKLFKVEGNQRVPFLDFPVVDLSVYWDAIFKGEIAGKVAFDKPVINFIGGSSEEKNQSGKDIDWTKPLKELMPLKIDQLIVRKGAITFNDFTTRPKVDLSMKDVNMTATNLSNAQHKAETLPSDVKLTANSIGNGKLNILMKIDVLKPMPDFDMNLKFEDVNIPALNDFFKAYAKVDLERGNFNLYSELALREGAITGYVKPIARDLKFIDWKDKEETKNVGHLLWEGIAGLVATIFKNHPNDQLATVVPVSGTVSKTDVNTWKTVVNILHNAFIKALPMETDGTVTFADAIAAYREQMVKGDKESEKDNKKEERAKKKEERKEKREERKEERKAKRERNKEENSVSE
ncbi:DUF748 domain-containing protein [Cytophagaceae bacterium YF14B1]|uniref:DUF748 domain-containing protein n=1 Tax=Xanthocytophaga flava TaxID=3048013 RepID=A0AAE3QMK5_9BACT|nr:DUF748 domain-containing protein [Xanthocytophaga flavus]MDJ1479830.1 DUF748 domain-containing protein [Xanthocytophaga flavus]